MPTGKAKEPKSWVKDEDIWKKAKTATGDGAGYDSPFAVVTHVYKKMGGTIGKGKQADTTSGFPQFTRSGVSTTPMKKKESINFKAVACKFVEAVTAKVNTALTDAVDAQNAKKREMHNKVNPGSRIRAKSLDGELDVLVDKKDVQGNQIYGTVMSGEKKGEKVKVAYQDILSVSKESKVEFVACRLRESTADATKESKFSTTLLREGLGNFKDRYYYTGEALETAVPIFEGKKIYADHPTESEEENRPERSVRDIIGHFENVHVGQDKDGSKLLEADVVLLKNEQWATDRMRHAIEYSKKYKEQDFVGLSINADGNSEERPLQEFMLEANIPDSAKAKLSDAQDKGIDSIKVVDRFIGATSCDLVTEAGAGGRINKMLEDKMGKKNKEAGFPGKPGDEKKPGSTQEQDDAGHDDAEQDKELIKSLLTKYVGKKDGEEPTEDEKAMCAEAIKHARDMGCEGEELEKTAGYGMKMVKHLASKAKETEEETEDETETEQETEEETEAEGGEKKCAECAKANDKFTKLMGRCTALEKEVKKFSMKESLDAFLKKSGQPFEVTKKFRETVKVEDLKSDKDIESKWSLFMEGANLRKCADGEADFVINMEKQAQVGDGALDLSDCV